MGLPPKKEQSRTSKTDKRKSKGVSLQGGGMMMSILELLQHIVNEPAPRLTPEGRFPEEAEYFVDSCLLKDPDARKTPKDLLVFPLSYIHRVVLTQPPRNIRGLTVPGHRSSISRFGQIPFEFFHGCPRNFIFSLIQPHIILCLLAAIVLIAHFILARRMYYRNTRNVISSTNLISRACFSCFATSKCSHRVFHR